MIRHVLERQGSANTRGADGRGPPALAMLPAAWLDALVGRMMGKWEEEGAWPESLRQVIFSMTPKPNAEQ